MGDAERKGQAEQDGSKPEADAVARTGNTQKARQSPTIPGAVARYCTNPLNHVYERLITHTNLGTTGQSEPVLRGQAEQEGNCGRGRDELRSNGQAEKQDEGCRAEPLRDRAEQQNC